MQSLQRLYQQNAKEVKLRSDRKAAVCINQILREAGRLTMGGLRQNFQILPEAADCSRTNLTMWLCPHKTITYEEARRMLLYKPPSPIDNYMEVFQCEDRACSTTLRHGLAHRGRGNWHAIGLITEITLLVVSDCDDHVWIIRQHFTANRIKLALAHLDFPLCKHLRTSNPVVYNHYTPNCTKHLRMGGPAMGCKCPLPPGTHRKIRHRRDYEVRHYKNCQKCLELPFADTCFCFRTWHRTVGGIRKLILSIDIWHDLGCLNRDSDQGWTCHAQSPVQTELYSQQWQRWIDYRHGTMAGWETRPATPIFEETTNESTPDEHRSLLSKCISLLHRALRTKRPTSC